MRWLNPRKIFFFILLFVLAGIASWYVVFEQQHRSLESIVDKQNLIPVVILGSGPAGLSAGLFTARAKFPTVVLAGPLPGGQLSWVRQIENFPAKKRSSGQEVIQDLERQAKQFGAVIVQDAAQSINFNQWPFIVKTESEKELRALSLIIATGRVPKKLHIPGVDTYWGHGVGVCTICDAPFHKNQIVGVVGGGDTAVDHALQLASYAKKVYMFVRDGDLDAFETAQEYVKENPKINIMYHTEIKEIRGNGKNVQSLIIENNQTRKRSELPAQGIYFAIGWHPSTDIVQPEIKTNAKGFIKIGCQNQATNVEGVFAAGDVTNANANYGKAGAAAGSGIKAGMDAIDYLQNISVGPQLIKKDATLQTQVETDSSISEITSKEMFDQFIKKYSDNLILLEFYTEYCPVCKAIIPVLQDIQKTATPKTYAAKLNIQDVPDLVKKFGVSTAPYFVVLKNGEVIGSSSSARSKNEILKLLKDAPKNLKKS